jgi:hypothetical protein
MWIEATVDGHWFQAKVFKSPSIWGISGGRVSKLTISSWPYWVNLNQIDCLYNYDRCPDFDNCPPDLLEKILAYCEEQGEMQ